MGVLLKPVLRLSDRNCRRWGREVGGSILATDGWIKLVFCEGVECWILGEVGWRDGYFTDYVY